MDGGLNTYSYVYQNPLSFSDPSGLVIGQLASQALNRLRGGALTAQEAAIGGRAVDAVLGSTATGVKGSLEGAARNAANAIQLVGGGQTVGLGGAFVMAGSGLLPYAGVGLGFIGGYEVGDSINDALLEPASNELFGGDPGQVIFCMLNPEGCKAIFCGPKQAGCEINPLCRLTE